MQQIKILIIKISLQIWVTGRVLKKTNEYIFRENRRVLVYFTRNSFMLWSRVDITFMWTNPVLEIIPSLPSLKINLSEYNIF